MTKAIPDIFEEWINRVSISQNIESIVDNFDGTATINTNCTWWALECNILTIGGIDYNIVSINRNESIIVKGLPSGNTFTLSNPFFIHGTPRQANSERDLRRSDGQGNLTPLIYLFEPIREDFNNELSAIQREVSLRFAVLNNFKDNQFTDDVYNYSVYAMRSFAEKLIDTIQKDNSLVDSETTTYNIISYTKYGQFIDRSGSTKNIFNENLAGVEVNLSVNLYNSCKECLNLCKC